MQYLVCTALYSYGRIALNRISPWRTLADDDVITNVVAYWKVLIRCLIIF